MGKLLLVLQNTLQISRWRRNGCRIPMKILRETLKRWRWCKSFIQRKVPSFLPGNTAIIKMPNTWKTLKFIRFLLYQDIQDKLGTETTIRPFEKCQNQPDISCNIFSKGVHLYILFQCYYIPLSNAIQAITQSVQNRTLI